MKYLKIIIPILIIVVAVIIFRVYDRLVDTKSEKARFELHFISEKLVKAKSECGSFPTSLTAFEKEAESCFSGLNIKISPKKDPWGNDYIYLSDGEHFTLKTKSPNAFVTDESRVLFVPAN